MPYGQYSKNRNGYSQLPSSGASGAIDFGDGNVTMLGNQGKYVNGVKTPTYSDGVPNRYNGRNSNNGGGKTDEETFYGGNRGSSDPRVLAQASAAGRQALKDQIAASKESGQNNLELSRARDQDADTSRERNSSRDFDRSSQATKRDQTFLSEETGKDRAKSSDEFRSSQDMAQKQINQDRSNQEFQSVANLRRDKQSQDNENFARSVDNNSKANLQAENNIASEKLANITSRTTLAGQGAQTEQARIAAKAQVTSALMGGRSNYGGYW